MTHRFARPSGQASWTFRRSAALVAVCCTSSIRRRVLGRLWDIDFVAHAQAQDGIGLTAIDHVSQSMHYDEMLSWLLFYTSLLNVTKTSQVDLIDPGGIVRSQVVHSRMANCGSRSTPLRASTHFRRAFSRTTPGPACNTSRLRPMTSSRLSGACRPTAWRCCRSQRTTTTIWRLGPTSLPSASTSYAERNILYDRDEGGEFLHACTRSFEGRFFFEIVERRGYKGLGTVNAPILLAAQARE